MLTPQAAIKSVFRNYATLAGRAPRSEFWWFALFQAVLFTVVVLLGGLGIGIGTPERGEMPVSMGIAIGVTLLLSLGLAIPNITVYVRRLHDGDFSGWLYFLACIPYAGVLVVLIFALLPSQPAGVRFDAVENTGSATPAWNPSKTLS
ncbi:MULTISPECIES: DUF805 domain-containing protein [unclassified Cryobacterium]|uniref:DUF805 domain-containing protein n=1 Tax=unclassified Cryobacterium TaxID=2649013 RepID=UPI00106D753A|nr:MULTISPECIES: DUF805 domain-containing protein [unclassified Cryobacterium]TFC58693.1 DUF805 domain-containing protein [Cryobacterium sp. TMB3-1-2]TFC67114.1 DUF805 domain-containing protein [Cryobacterium sp. TMB3-15]TFC73373.1 DUF805 domain-containing protein [Cryobacterium sp. TMB3-10]TFD44154.1 DUF805 domain-containing protein [Cryobacterium sp. TMB3-12]